MKRKPTAQQATAEVVQLAGQVWEILKKFDHLRESYRPRPVLETALLSGFIQLRGVASTIVSLESRIDPACLPVVVLARCLLELVPTSPDVSFLSRVSAGALRDALRKADRARIEWLSAQEPTPSGEVQPQFRMTAKRLLTLQVFAKAESPLQDKEALNRASKLGVKAIDTGEMDLESFRQHILRPLTSVGALCKVENSREGRSITTLGRSML